MKAGELELRVANQARVRLWRTGKGHWTSGTVTVPAFELSVADKDDERVRPARAALDAHALGEARS